MTRLNPIDGPARDTVDRLRVERNSLYVSENANSAVARVLLVIRGRGDEGAWREIWDHCHDDLKADEIDREIRRIEERGAQ